MGLKEEMLSAAIRARAEELAEADEDMVVDKPSEEALGVGVAVLVSFETLLPLFDGDKRRTILYLQHVMGEVLTRPTSLPSRPSASGSIPWTRSTRCVAPRHRSSAPAGTFDYERPGDER
jgi:hypothetical protein